MTEAAVPPAGPAQDRRPPLPAMILGHAGLLPPIVALGLWPFADPIARPMLLLVTIGYGAIILSFLGGMWWSAAAIGVRGPALWPWLVAAVLPSLVGFGGLLLVVSGLSAGGVVIAIGLLASLAVDTLLKRRGHVPPWWMRLRVPLSVGLAVLTLVASLLLPG